MPVIGKAASLAQGPTPIVIRWDYNALAGRDTLKGNPPVDVVVPKTGVVAGVYVQAISAYAPHPNAAKLWMEYLYSDEGQLGWLKGYCHPIRFNDLAKNGKIPADVLAKLPPAEAYAKAVFPTLDEQDAAKEAITKKLGHGRRRERQVSMTDRRAAVVGRPVLGSERCRRMTELVADPGSAPLASKHRRRPTAARQLAAADAWLGVAPFFIFAVLFLILPTLYLVRRRLPGRRRRLHARQHRRPVRSRRSSAPIWISIKISVASAIVGAFVGFAIAIAIVRGGLPQLDALGDADDLLRRRLELRRRAAGLRLPRHARPRSASSPCC